jgi:Flp pilus assembly protein TadG
MKGSRRRAKGSGETCYYFRWILLQSSEGAQLVEFALVLPLFLAMVVGIFDFGQAYNLKQKLNNAAREGARFAIEESCADCTQAAPATTQAIENSIVNYLANAGVNLCGLTGTTTPTTNPPKFASWTFTSPQQCTGTGANFTIQMDRGITFVDSNGVTVCATHITVNSPYAWSFNSIIGFLVPGANYAAVTTLSSDATMQNLPGGC